MNKKGFTLVELLAVIAIIGIIGLIAVPNMLGISDNVKKDQILDDAKKAISLAKMKVNTDYEIRTFKNDSICTSNTCTLYLKDIDEKKEIVNDPDGGLYNRDTSYVRYANVTVDGNVVTTYCIYLQGSKRKVEKSSSCVQETELFSKNNVK